MERRAYPPIEHETRPTVDTGAAAYYLNRSPDTLRTWSCLGVGPVRPIRIHGRLAWPTASIRQVLGLVQTPGRTGISSSAQVEKGLSVAFPEAAFQCGEGVTGA